MESENVQPHVVLVPLPVQGHINPFYSLALFLADAGISVTFVHSTRTHSPCSSSADAAPQHGQGSIRIAVMPEAESSGPSLSNFKDSIPIMCKGLEEILEKLRQEDNAPCCLISDKLLPWCHGVALKFGLPRIELFTSSASVLSMGMHIPEMIAHGYVPATDQELLKKTVDFIPGLSPIRVADMPGSMNAVNGLQDPAFQFISSAFEHSKSTDRILVNSMYELEGNVVEARMTDGGVRIDPVGPLFMVSSITSTESSGPSLLQEDTSCLAWLDQQGKSSVLYISFGSIATIDDDAFKEMAHGVEASGVRFLWVIRQDELRDKTQDELLPKGFMERTKDRGLLISWAPQLAVLGHPSVGAFLTHCGWNSVLESLSNGVAMLGFPVEIAEQRTICKLMAQDWGVGFPLLEAGANKVERTYVQQAVRAIMNGVEGREVRKRALEWRDRAHKAFHGTSKMNLHKLVDDLKSGYFKASR